MAVFLLNICKFNGCGITFPSLSDLITHIEDTHIDYDPKVVEQKEQSQPSCLPLSYVLRFISDDARKDGPFLSANTAGVELKRKLAIKHHSYSMSSSNRSNTPTGSEMDDDEMVVSESEDSNESWTTEEFSSEFIMRYGSRHSGNGNAGTPGNEKPFACPVPGCKKRYKNVNGIKYHSKNGHKKDGKVRKGYKCHCGKSYKTAQGLKNHALLAHNSSSETVINANSNSSNGNAALIQRSSSPSQSLGSLSPSSISNMSSSASSCHGTNGSLNGNSSAVLHQLTTNTGSINLQQQLINVTAISNNNNQHQTNNSNSQNQTNSQHQQHGLLATPSATAQTTESPSLSTPANVFASTTLAYTTTIQSITTSTTTSALSSSSPSSKGTHDNAPHANNAIGQFPAVTPNTKKLTMPMQQQPMLGATMRTAPMLLQSTIRTSSSNAMPATAQFPAAAAAVPPAAHTPIISPTFIEHKYSANIYKEKFLSHIRNTTSNTSTNNNLTVSTPPPYQNATNSSPKILFSTNTTTTSNNVAVNEQQTRLLETTNIVDSSNSSNSSNIGDLCSSIQQLNESFKNNLFKKTIN